MVSETQRIPFREIPLNTMRNVGMMFSFAVALAVAAASMPPELVNEVFLGTVGHLESGIALAFTSAMSHAFVASIIICLVALGFSAVREGRRTMARPLPAEPAASPQPTPLTQEKRG